MSEWPTWATEQVRVQPPDEGWQRRGAQLCRELDAVLARWLVAPTQHVGSTAVAGLAAKPIFDVQAAVIDLGCADAVAEVLAPAGWHLVPAELDARPWRRFLVQVIDHHRAAHLHLLPSGSPRWAEQLAFRDVLRADPALVHRYAELKRALAVKHAADREGYTAGKADFVRRVLDDQSSLRPGVMAFSAAGRLDATPVVGEDGGMLLSNDVARGIADGTISVVFRRWRHPNVTAGDTLRTVAGVIAIDSITAIEPSEISVADALASGAGSPAELLSSLRGSSDQILYRIAVHWHGPDPRDALSAESTLSHEQVDQIGRRLAILDKRSSHGAWTHATLRRIAVCPGRPARELAEALGRDKEGLKLDIRKLKNLGLTRSLQAGYQIAPRGAEYLAAIDV